MPTMRQLIWILIACFAVSSLLFTEVFREIDQMALNMQNLIEQEIDVTIDISKRLDRIEHYVDIQPDISQRTFS